MDLEDLATVIDCAELAPSVHNTQPWTWSVEGDSVEVRADRGRLLPVLDPTGRQLTVSCGAAIEYADIAMRGLGWSCTTELFPDPDDADLLAVVRAGDRRPASVETLDLLDALPRRYTDRESYEPQRVGPELRSRLERGVSQRGSWLRVVDDGADRLAVIQALANAEAIEAANPAYRQELERWLRIGHAPDGIPSDALGGSEPDRAVSDVQLRDFTGHNTHARPGGDGPPPIVERDTVIMLGTETDTPRDWLQAGRALGWLLLTLTVAGLSSQPLGQALDIDASRTRLSRQIGLTGHVQFMVRTGIGHGAPTTSRRQAWLSNS